MTEYCISGYWFRCTGSFFVTNITIFIWLYHYCLTSQMHKFGVKLVGLLNIISVNILVWKIWIQLVGTSLVATIFSVTVSLLKSERSADDRRLFTIRKWQCLVLYMHYHKIHAEVHKTQRRSKPIKSDSIGRRIISYACESPLLC